MNDRLSGVFTFVQAAEAGSFALAAQRLGVTRSAVGKSIARLEEQLGVQPWRFPDAEGGLQEAPISSRVRFDDTEAIAVAATAGAGLALLPSWLVADKMRSGQLVRVLEGVPGMSCEIRAIWPQTRHLPSRVRVTIDALVAGIPKLLAMTPG